MSPSAAAVRTLRAGTTATACLDGSWEAELSLGFARVGMRTSLVKNVHRGPLCVHRPFYPEGEDHPHVYLLHPPGGLVSGDRLCVEIDLESSTRALFTTPGAGRFYRARPGRRLQQQSNRLMLGDGAICEWLPQENILFAGSNCLLETQVSLSTRSRFVGWEITVLGLPARRDGFGDGCLRQRFSIDRDGTPLLREQLTVNAASRRLLTGNAGLRGAAVSGVLVAGPFGKDADLSACLRALRDLEPVTRYGCPHWGATRHGDFVLLRYLGADAEQAKLLFTAAWSALRVAWLGRPAVRPRIWAT